MEHVMDWSINGRGEHANELHWVFFYADVEHEVSPVKSGYRITISYDIHGTHNPYRDVSRFDQTLWVQYQGEAYEEEEQYGTGKIPESPPHYDDPEHNQYKSALEKVDVAWKLNPIFRSLLDAFHNKAFLPNGGRLAFGLDHEYGLGGWQSPVKKFDWCLKGRDAAMFAAVKALGLPYELKAVYKMRDNRHEIENAPWTPIDEFSSEYNHQYLLLWDDFSGLSTNDIEFTQDAYSLFAERDLTSENMKMQLCLVSFRGSGPVSTLHSSGYIIPPQQLRRVRILGTETSLL